MTAFQKISLSETRRNPVKKATRPYQKPWSVITNVAKSSGFTTQDVAMKGRDSEMSPSGQRSKFDKIRKIKFFGRFFK